MAKDAAKLGPDTARTEFLLRVLEPARRMVIADVGARKISTPPPYDELRAKDGCEVVGFEPNEAAFAVLESEKSANSTYFNVAVGEPGSATFYNHPIGSISSLFRISEKQRQMCIRDSPRRAQDRHPGRRVGRDEVRQAAAL